MQVVRRGRRVRSATPLQAPLLMQELRIQNTRMPLLRHRQERMPSNLYAVDKHFFVRWPPLSFFLCKARRRELTEQMDLFHGIDFALFSVVSSSPN